MTTGAPVEMVWSDGALRPITPYWERTAAKQFVVGEVYRIIDEPERSGASHRHYFASIANAHANLPVLLAERFPTPEHLRRYALIKAGYCNSHSLTCGSRVAAKATAAWARPLDEFSVVTVTGSVVNVYTAKSQSYRSMSKKDFQESKDRVLDIIADMIGVAKGELNEPSQLQYLAAG